LITAEFTENAEKKIKNLSGLGGKFLPDEKYLPPF
jgi:hypothetical protein